MKLIFTAEAKIDPEHSALFNQIAVDIRKNFTDTIESVSRQHVKNLDWWFSSPASRNTFSSTLFHYCCCLVLLQELIRANEPIDEIVTDSRAFKKILENYLADCGFSRRITLSGMSLKQCLKEIVRPVYVMLGLPLNYILLFFAARGIQPLRKSLTQPLTLIDTFIMPGYIEKDRYYPGLLDVLSEEEKRYVWFVPHLYGFHPWQFLSVVSQLRKSKKNFVLKDDFLKFNDYWCLWNYLFRVLKLQVKSCIFSGVDISRLVREELTGFRSIGFSYVSLLNYRFAKRLKDTGVKLRLVIDWFENQSMDKGWNAGFRHFFPEVETAGYQGFIPAKHFLSLYPTEVERENAILPHKIFVMGNGLVHSIREFCPALDVKVAPAFRFQHVWHERKCLPDKNIYTILVTLPNILKDTIAILKLLALENKNSAGIRFWIKPHPGMPKARIKAAYGSVWPEHFEFVDGDLSFFIEKANLLISSASSTCMEALTRGIPVIIVGNTQGLTNNLIPETITDDIWKLCYSRQEVEEAIQFYKSRSTDTVKDYEKAGRRIREEYFEPVTEKSIREFMNLVYRN